MMQPDIDHFSITLSGKRYNKIDAESACEERFGKNIALQKPIKNLA